MTDIITLTGIVATPPKAMRTGSGLTICSFRLASSHRRFDRTRNEWVDGDTNWFTVTAFRHLADNVAASLQKGEHIVVMGRLRIRAWESGDRSGTTVEVDAEAIGHDLLWGRTQFTKVPPARTSAAPSDPARDLSAGQEPAEPPRTDVSAPPAASAPLAPSLLAAASAPLVPNAWPSSAPEAGTAALDDDPGASTEARADSRWHDEVEVPF
jgi:single-strand DNA-binding protein